MIKGTPEQIEAFEKTMDEDRALECAVENGYFERITLTGKEYDSLYSNEKFVELYAQDYYGYSMNLMGEFIEGEANAGTFWGKPDKVKMVERLLREPVRDVMRENPGAKDANVPVEPIVTRDGQGLGGNG